MRIEWDPEKNRGNVSKHGVSFNEAAQLLASTTNYLEIYDEIHSEVEARFIAIGPIDRGVIVVVYTEEDDGVLRIISARMATKHELRRYEDHEKASR